MSSEWLLCERRSPACLHPSSCCPRYSACLLRRAGGWQLDQQHPIRTSCPLFTTPAPPASHYFAQMHTDNQGNPINIVDGYYEGDFFRSYLPAINPSERLLAACTHVQHTAPTPLVACMCIMDT